MAVDFRPNGALSMSRAFWILDVASSISAVSDDAGLFFGDFIGILTKLHTHCRCLSTGFFAKIENVFSGPVRDRSRPVHTQPLMDR